MAVRGLGPSIPLCNTGRILYYKERLDMCYCTVFTYDMKSPIKNFILDFEDPLASSLDSVLLLGPVDDVTR